MGVVDDSAVGDNREPMLRDVRPEVVHPPKRSRGHEHNRDASLIDPRTSTAAVYALTAVLSVGTSVPSRSVAISTLKC